MDNEKYYHFELDVRGITAEQAEVLLDAFVALAEEEAGSGNVASVVIPMEEEADDGKAIVS